MRSPAREERRKGRARVLLLAAMGVAACLGCSRSRVPQGNEAPARPEGAISVFVVNYPLRYFTEQVGGSRVNVRFPAPPNEDPAFWVPDAETIAAYQRAELVVLNGATYAKWVEMASLPKAKLVDSSASFKSQYIKLQDAVTHSHGPGGEHAHAGTAFTTWLDPQLAIAQAETIRDALVRTRPEYAPEFEKNLESLRRELRRLDQEIADLVARGARVPVVFSHPVYQYFTRRYHVNARTVHWEPDEFPSSEMWMEFEQLLQEHPAHWMIWEGTPREQTAAKLRELNVESVVFDPAGNVPDDGDYLEVMRRNVAQLTQVFGDAR